MSAASRAWVPSIGASASAVVADGGSALGKVALAAARRCSGSAVVPSPAERTGRKGALATGETALGPI